MMPDNLKDNNSDDGVLGIEAMSKGIWKIDFKRNELTFASAIDSIKEINQTEIFPATFSQQSITVNVDFGDNNVKTMFVDLGYNGSLLMPLDEFKSIKKWNKPFIKMVAILKHLKHQQARTL